MRALSLAEKRMACKWQCVATPVLVVWLAASTTQQGCNAQTRRSGNDILTRGSFPKGFVFGTAASAYQVFI